MPVSDPVLMVGIATTFLGIALTLPASILLVREWTGEFQGKRVATTITYTVFTIWIMSVTVAGTLWVS